MGAVIFSVGPCAALYCTQLLGLRHTSGHKVLTTAVTAPPLAMTGKWAHSPAPWQDPSELMQHVLPGESSQEILLVPPAFLLPTQPHWCASVQPFYFSSFSAGTSGLWTRHIHVLSAISSEAFELCSHFPVPKFMSPVSLPRQ